MELKDFVSDTIVAICDGVRDAIDRIDAAGGIGSINPHWLGDDARWDRNVERVEFDVSITAQKRTETGGKAGMKIVVAEFGGDIKTSHETNVLNRVKFAVPMVFPASARFAKDPVKTS